MWVSSAPFSSFAAADSAPIKHAEARTRGISLTRWVMDFPFTDESGREPPGFERSNPADPGRLRKRSPWARSRVREASELVAPLEENGFSLLDFTPEGLEVRLFRWLPEEGEAALDTLQPFEVLSFPRPAG